MNRFTLSILLFSLLLLSATSVFARNQINIVGSSTVYPFATVVAENFALRTVFKAPKIESTGSGGGLKLFCEGLGVDTPDITSASRRIKQSEIDKCRKNGITEIIEIKIGYDGITIAQSKEVERMQLSLKQIFLALTKDIPNPDGSENFVPNPHKKWSDLDSLLPSRNIEVLGPPPTSGTRDAFVELAMEGGCKEIAWIKAMKKTDKKTYKARCHSIREDGAYIEAGENDNLIVQKLKANPSALGILGFSFLDQNTHVIQGAVVENTAPEFEKIASGEYLISRSLYLYVKKAHIGIIPGIKEYLNEFISDTALGEEGYLIDKGMIPTTAKEKAIISKAILSLEILPEKI